MLKTDVAVIGAGIVGCSIARELSRYKLDILLIDKEPDFGFGATKANSAVVHAGYDDKNGTLKSKLCVRGNMLYESLSRDMGVDFERNGSLLVGFNEDDERRIEELYENGMRNGVPDLRILDGTDIKNKEAKLSDEIVSALYAPSAGITTPYEMAIALAENAIANGVKSILENEVVDIDLKEERARISSLPLKLKDAGTGKRTDIECRMVVNCAGIYSDEISRMALNESSFRIYPRRGEYFLFDKKKGSLVNSTIFPTPSELGKGILITKTCEGSMMIGPNAVDIKEKDDLSTTADGLSEVWSGVKEIIPSIDEMKAYVIKNFAGLRAQSDLEDFIIEEHGSFINVAGIKSPGLTAAPAIGEYVALLIKDALEPDKKEVFNPKRERPIRFRELSAEEREKVIRSDPRYGHIICRCEYVSEGEIIDAIRSGARTVDGIKFRTRAGMGRCQGGFDLPFILDIMSRELGVDVEEITKYGKGSEIVKGKTKDFLKYE